MLSWILGLAGIGTNLASALIGANAAGNASEAQQEAAKKISDLATVQGAKTDTAYNDFINNTLPTLTGARDEAIGAATRGTTDAGILLQGERNQAETQAQFERQRALEATQPYVNLGIQGADQLKAGFSPDGTFNTPFTADNFKQLDPGFDFRMQEAQKALERSAFAKGTGLSGATLKAIDRYSQDYGASEFNAAFQRYQQANDQRYRQLIGLTDVGSRAISQDMTAGSNSVDQRIRAGSLFTNPQAESRINLGNRIGDVTLNTAQQQANLELQARNAKNNAQLDLLGIQGNAAVGAGNARAQGTIGAANAWSSGLTGGASAITNAVLLNEIMRKAA